MTVIAVTTVRDEADIVGWTVGHMAGLVDHVLVADNLSTDDTAARAGQYPNVTVLADPDPAHRHATKTDRLAARAADMGATWIVPFDGDEIWHELPDFDQLPDDVGVCVARWYTYVPHTDDDPADPNPLTRTRWRKPDPERFSKVCWRAHPGARAHMGSHGVDHPGVVVAAGVVRHYQYRSLDQVARKVRQGTSAIEAAPEFDMSICAHWRQLAALDDDQLATWWRHYLDQPLVCDP